MPVVSGDVHFHPTGPWTGCGNEWSIARPAFETAITFRRRTYVAITQLSWVGLIFIGLSHATICFWLLVAVDEDRLTGEMLNFAYFYVTTATTVGYGDLAPEDQLGRLITLTLVMPGAIAVFTAFLGKGLSDLAGMWRARMHGFGNVSDRRDHTIVLGWQGGRTRRLIELLADDQPEGDRIVLVAKSLEQNPLPLLVDYVRVDALSIPSELQRAGVERAKTIVVRGQDDDETLAATLAVVAEAASVHIVSFFEDERSVALVRRHCPKVEVIGSMSEELLVRASRDPGASSMAGALFSTETPSTAFSLEVPHTMMPTKYVDLLQALRRRYAVTLVGVRQSQSQGVQLNCADDSMIKPGDTLFYISDIRLSASSVAWNEIVI